MNDLDLSELVDAWILGTTKGRDERGRETDVYKETWWALSTVMNWVQDNEPELLWLFILLVHERDTEEIVAGNLAAGPVEDLLSYYGESYIERVEELAREDPRFKRMLGGTWQDGMSNELWARFQRARTGAC
jgi:hypothetical protein